jgi:hypothetical protein
MTTQQVKNYYESGGEDDHSSDSDYIEEDEYGHLDDITDRPRCNIHRSNRSACLKPDAHTIEMTAIKKNMREKKEKKKTDTKKITKVRGYKRLRISDGVDWTASLDPDVLRTRSEYKRYKENCKLHDAMLVKLKAQGNVFSDLDNDIYYILRNKT